MQDKEVLELEKALEQIWEIALRLGLDPFPTKFEIVPASVMYEIGSYALPGRYSHWTFGKAYHRMKTMYDFGLSKIYEVVINTNPSYAFLLETNNLLQNKLVIAHVLGHTDFFKNNVYFSKTNRRMIDTVSSHTARMTAYEFKYGHKRIEEFLDSVLAIEEHIDPNFFIRRESKEKEKEPLQKVEGRYDDLWTPYKSDEDAQKDESKSELDLILEIFDEPEPKKLNEKDVLGFIAANSPILEDWQRDIMAMIHEEMEYFVPQMQTKIMNEGWACATGDSLLVTENGFIRFKDLYEDYKKIKVASGRTGELNWITDFHKEKRVPTIKIRTRRGLEIEGALKHRVQLADGSWEYLKSLKIGDRVSLANGTEVWAEQNPKINYVALQPSFTLENIAVVAGVSSSTVIRHLQGRDFGPKTVRGPIIDNVIEQMNYCSEIKGRILPTRQNLYSNDTLSENLAWLLGYFVGDGNLTPSGIGFTTGDEEIKDKLVDIVGSELGLNARVKFDTSGNHRRWRIIIHSREIWRWLKSVGINLKDKARTKKIPWLILQSPKNIISAFLRGYFDADGYAEAQGVILSSASKELINTVQIILLNFGILSRSRRQQHDIWNLEITGQSVKRFFAEIGFSLKRKYDILHDCLAKHFYFEKEDFTDEIVEITHQRADVYDITVEGKHAYVANGFINHNSFWHSRIMREMDLPDAEHIEFAELHSGVVSPHRNQLNPYYLGYKVFEYIEHQEGREKIFEVRELDNDVSFLRNYLTEELVEDLDLFVFELVDEEEWTVTEKRWEKVRDQLVANMTNFGFPYIVVADGDYKDNRELYLKHLYEGTELDRRYAEKTLEHVYKLWGKTVYLETMVDEEKTVWSFDGEDFIEE
jgi:stage V sporulation protein R